MIEKINILIILWSISIFFAILSITIRPIGMWFHRRSVRKFEKKLEAIKYD